ncbi:hypothetical protein AN478_07065 [Thiohalorhabdus denitrificans]|uniref:5' nucleotidase, deoxy (Pyrimidine), type C protein (NT5C) n=1 Tax=Thiohalorhabdus denitrificans TaxID=381306 RepID=A0A0P9GIU7_9GAMM|nr:HAD domain-containing protein [Thiohalorhabdus denitrificans]KPV39948.1 hypothetical protein AN478_07065 [Thiohalorhabdus denitrificans]SCY09459.1 hypothetical protein SAMN05661077_1175 [Thiohalorhabdus denitrificans]
MDRVVIADIDGVLNRSGAPFPPFGWYEPRRGEDGQWGLALPTDPVRKLATFLAVLDEGPVARLRTLAEGSGAGLVLCSGWRKFVPRRLIRDALAAAGWPDPPIVAYTPVLGLAGRGDGMARRRASEIRQWLEHNRPEAWVVLDDLPLSRYLENAIQVRDGRGLEEAEIQKAYSVLIP